MNETLKAVIVEVSGGNIRNHPINLRGAFGLFPDDCFGGSNEAAAGKSITLQVGANSMKQRRFFESGAQSAASLLMKMFKKAI